MTKAAIYLFVLIAALNASTAYKILVVFPLPLKSHWILGKSAVTHLLKAGHEVTFLTQFTDEYAHHNLTYVDASSADFEEVMKVIASYREIKSIMDGNKARTKPMLIPYITRMLTKATLESSNVQKFLNDTTKQFDLVIAEWIFNELFASFAAIYNAPFIWLTTTEPETMILSVVDGYLNPSYNGFFLTENPPFTLMERLSHLWYSIVLFVYRETTMSYLQAKDYNTLVVPLIEARGREAPPFSEMKYNASMVLGMSHVSMGTTISLPQIYKQIGGFHIDDKVEPLSEALKNILDNAAGGVIYFSMGTNVGSKDWPEFLKREFIQMFSSLKQTVIWVIDDTIPDLPSNVHILPWAPQKIILAHPNCVLFITQGGILSITENLNAGKPIVGIPVFADQFLNVVSAVGKGYAIKVDLSYSMTKDLKSAIEEILGNPKYAQKAKEMSFVFHDRPVKPSDELVHWAEHVIKTQGASYIRSPALLVPWYQKYYIDLALIILFIYIVLRKIIKKLSTDNSPKNISEKRKKN